MRKKALRSGPGAILAILLILVSALTLAGCTETAPPTGPGPQGGRVTVTPTVTTSVIASTGPRDYMVHVPGQDRGTLLLVGRSTCPWCLKTKDLLANMNADYWWIDLDTLDQAEADEVTASLSSVKGCEQISGIPILVIRGERCIIGYQEQAIREAVG